jgi:hypothetical protein
MSKIHDAISEFGLLPIAPITEFSLGIVRASEYNVMFTEIPTAVQLSAATYWTELAIRSSHPARSKHGNS